MWLRGATPVRHKSERPFPAPPVVTGVPSVEDARREQRASTERFVEAAHHGPEVRRVSSHMRKLRIENGYEELIESAMERRRGPR